MFRDIYFFNPTCELAVVNGSAYYVPPARLRAFERDLSFLPAFLAKQDDVVLVQDSVPMDFQKSLETAGFHLPMALTYEECLSFIQNVRVGRIFPWGWSPAAHHFLKRFKSICHESFKSSPVFNWTIGQRDLYCRKEGLSVLEAVVINNCDNWLPSKDDLPVICRTEDEIRALQQRWERVVVKAPWSSSGRGLQVLKVRQYNQTNHQFISGVIQQQGFVTAGPWHEKIIDLSFQFFSFGNGQIVDQGLTCFMTDGMGRYTGNYIEEISDHLDQKVACFIREKKEQVKSYLMKALSESRYATEYNGWFGVDALVFRDTGGELFFHPCVEINCRFTMGAIALSLRDHISPESSGMFKIYRGESGALNSYYEEMKTRHPLQITDKRIDKGFLALTPPTEQAQFGAYLLVTNNS